MRLPLCSTAFQQACGEFNNLIIPAMLSKVNANTAFHPVVFCKLSQNQQNVFNNIVDSLGFSFPAWPRRHAGYPPAGGMVFIAPAQLRCSGGHNVRVTYPNPAWQHHYSYRQRPSHPPGQCPAHGRCSVRQSPCWPRWYRSTWVPPRRSWPAAIWAQSAPQTAPRRPPNRRTP